VNDDNDGKIIQDENKEKIEVKQALTKSSFIILEANIQ